MSAVRLLFIRLQKNSGTAATAALRQQRTSREGLANVGDKIVSMFDPDRHANQ